ncbi:MAG: right-handed parallel beta-helix repeat-containing protein, partial [Ignavibacteriaceae bacterium]|nr:right-handed parallel beta-helix repeat-containing protein [Ignavibacteriaceae bacterium]
SNSYLEIEPIIGSTPTGEAELRGRGFIFTNNASLIINGNLKAKAPGYGYYGSGLSYELTFWGASGQSWGGLVFNSGSSGSIKYGNIQNAVTGITCYSSLPDIKNSSFLSNSTGLAFYNVGTPAIAISDNRIEYNTNRGVYLSYSSLKIYNNTISNNGYHGIYCYYSSPYLYDNVINGHSGSGLNFTSYSSARLVPWNASGCCWGHGDNNINNNSGRGINASYWSNLYLGSSPYGGFNSIYNNTGYELSAMYNCNIMAEINFWGSPFNSNEFYT